MKVLIILALCIVATLAMPANEQTQPITNDESQLLIEELEPQDTVVIDESGRVKRQYGGYGGYGGNYGGGYGGGRGGGYGGGYGGYGGGGYGGGHHHRHHGGYGGYGK